MAAREDYAKRGYQVDYFDVKQQRARLEEMLKLAPERRVPVIDEGGKITVGFGGT